MLGALRRHSKSFIIYLLFAMIIVVFVFTFNTGAGRGGGCTPPEVPVYGKVASNTITQDTFIMGMNLLPDFFRSPAGMMFALSAGLDTGSLMRSDVEELTPGQANAMMQAVEMIYLASDEALRMGFRIGELELAKAMYPQSFYKEEEESADAVSLEGPKKVFDRKAYLNWVTYGLHASEQEYEDFVRRVLLAFRLQSFMSGVVQVEPVEAELMAKARGTKVDLSYAAFRPDTFGSLAVASDADERAFVAANEEKIKAYYDAHPDRFHAPEAFKLAVIFKAARIEEPQRGEAPSAPKPITKEELAAAKVKADDLLERVNGKKPLFPAGAPIEVQVPEGGGTVKVEDPTKKEEPKDPLERFKELAKRESDDKATAERSGLISEWQTPFDIEGLPMGKEVAAALGAANPGTVVGPVETPNGYYLVFVQEKREKKDESLDAARDGIAKRLLGQEKAPEMAKAEAEKFLAAVAKNEKTDLDAVMEETKKQVKTLLKEEDYADLDMLKVSKSGKFSVATPDNSVPGIGSFEALFKDAFKLSDKAPLASKVYVHPDTKVAYVVKLVEKVGAPATVEKDQLDQEREGLSFSRDLPYFESWLRSLRQAAVEGGTMERTADFESYIAYLQNRIDEAEKAKAKEAAKAE